VAILNVVVIESLSLSKTSDGLYLFAKTHPAPEAFVITKDEKDFGPLTEIETARGRVQPFRVPAFLFLYLLGAAERNKIEK